MKPYSLLVVIFILLTSCNSEKAIPSQKELPKLKIFSIHSNIWERSWQNIFKEFEDKNNCDIEFTLFRNSSLLLEELKKNPKIDVVIGLDNINYLTQEIDSLFLPYVPLTKDKIKKDLIFDNNFSLTPIAYGDLSFIINQEEITALPYTFGIMQDGIFKNNILFPDPRTSSLGKAFLLWSIAAFGENGYGHFWRSIKANIHTITSNWDEAYNAFLAGEAPIVLGFSTIPYYHQIHDSLQIYTSVIPSEGGFRLIEAAGIFHLTKKPALSKQLIEFLLNDNYQKDLIKSRWVKPVTAVELPAKIDHFPRQENDLTNRLKRDKIKNNYIKWQKRWVKLITK